MLPDLLQKDLLVVFCGTAPSEESAKRKAYYAKPGNKFYPTLAKIGLTPHLLKPHEYPTLLELGIGLTDLNKIECGIDSQLSPHCFDVEGLKKKIEKYEPRYLAFTSKRAGAEFFGLRSTQNLNYGRHELNKHTTIFVLPSTSGLATSHWNEDVWMEFAREVLRNK